MVPDRERGKEREASIETNGRPQNAIAQDIRRGATAERAENKKRRGTDDRDEAAIEWIRHEEERGRSCRSVRKPEQDVSTRSRDSSLRYRNEGWGIH